MIKYLIVGLGIACAVWLNEYAKEGPLKKLITLAVANLAGEIGRAHV